VFDHFNGDAAKFQGRPPGTGDRELDAGRNDDRLGSIGPHKGNSAIGGRRKKPEPDVGSSQESNPRNFRWPPDRALCPLRHDVSASTAC
jgi:hypothetical protein